MLVTVFPAHNTAAWQGSPSLDELPRYTGSQRYNITGSPLSYTTLPLARALEFAYRTDAHLGRFYIRGEEYCPRIGKDAPRMAPDTDIWLDVMMIDVDYPKQGLPMALGEWKKEIIGKALSLPWVPGWKETRGGIHLFWELDNPLTPSQYTPYATAFREHVASQYGIDADKACDKWMQLFRLPYVHRDDKDQRLAGDWGSISTLTWQRPVGDEDTRGYLGEILDATPMKPAFTLPDVLAEGDRDVLLTAYAGQLVGQGKSEADILVHLQLANIQRCKPPLENADIQRITHSIGGRYQVTEDNLDHLINFKVQRSVIFEGDPSYIHLYFEGETRHLKLTIDELEKLDTFKSAYLNKFTQKQLILPSGKGSQARWAEITYLWRKNAGAPHVIAEQASNAAEIAIRDWIMDVETIIGGDGKHLDKQRAITLPDKFGERKLFKLQSLIEELPEVKSMSNNELGQQLEQLGCTTPGSSARVRLRNSDGHSKQYRVWVAPKRLSLPPPVEDDHPEAEARDTTLDPRLH